MSAWLYQMSEKEWPSNRYRLEVWEGETWRYSRRRLIGGGIAEPAAGDLIVFFYAKTGALEPGFYGWAVAQEWTDESVYFRPATPSDFLKMNPWWDSEAAALIAKVKGGSRGTIWLINEEHLDAIRGGIKRWLRDA